MASTKSKTKPKGSTAVSVSPAEAAKHRAKLELLANADLSAPDDTIRAEIAPNLSSYLLDIEYRHYEDDSNLVSRLVKRNAQEAIVHTASISLIIPDTSKYVSPPNSGSSDGIIEDSEGVKLTEELKYYIEKALYQFTSSVDSRITVTRCVVQNYTLPGIPFIII